MHRRHQIVLYVVKHSKDEVLKVETMIVVMKLKTYLLESAVTNFEATP